MSLILSGMTAIGWSKGVGSRWATCSAKWFSPVLAAVPMTPSPIGMAVIGAACPSEISSSSRPVFSLTMKRWNASAPIRLMTISWTMRTTSL